MAVTFDLKDKATVAMWCWAMSLKRDLLREQDSSPSDIAFLDNAFEMLRDGKTVQLEQLWNRLDCAADDAVCAEMDKAYREAQLSKKELVVSSVLTGLTEKKNPTVFSNLPSHIQSYTTIVCAAVNTMRTDDGFRTKGLAWRRCWITSESSGGTLTRNTISIATSLPIQSRENSKKISGTLASATYSSAKTLKRYSHEMTSPMAVFYYI